MDQQNSVVKNLINESLEKNTQLNYFLSTRIKDRELFLETLSLKIPLRHTFLKGISHPRTSSLVKDFEDPDLTTVPYKQGYDSKVILDSIQRKDVIIKYHLWEQLEIFLSFLFDEKLIDPYVFDCVLLQYYKVPILLFYNQDLYSSLDELKVSKKYSIFYELTQIRSFVNQQVEDAVKEQYYKMQVKELESEYSSRRKWENFQFFLTSLIPLLVILLVIYFEKFLDTK